MAKSNTASTMVDDMLLLQKSCDFAALNMRSPASTISSTGGDSRTRQYTNAGEDEHKNKREHLKHGVSNAVQKNMFSVSKNRAATTASTIPHANTETLHKKTSKKIISTRVSTVRATARRLGSGSQSSRTTQVMILLSFNDDMLTSGRPSRLEFLYQKHMSNPRQNPRTSPTADAAKTLSVNEASLHESD